MSTTTPRRKTNPSLPPTVQGKPVTPPPPTRRSAPPPAATETSATAPVALKPEQDAGFKAEHARVKLIDLEMEIRDVTAEIAGFIKQAVPHARRAGALLAEAKAAIKEIDGDITFAEWVQSKCKLTVQTANRYVRIAAIPSAGSSCRR